jgi:hypothetical protein
VLPVVGGAAARIVENRVRGEDLLQRCIGCGVGCRIA